MHTTALLIGGPGCCSSVLFVKAQIPPTQVTPEVKKRGKCLSCHVYLKINMKMLLLFFGEFSIQLILKTIFSSLVS